MTEEKTSALIILKLHFAFPNYRNLTNPTKYPWRIQYPYVVGQVYLSWQSTPITVTRFFLINILKTSTTWQILFLKVETASRKEPYPNAWTVDLHHHLSHTRSVIFHHTFAFQTNATWLPGLLAILFSCGRSLTSVWRISRLQHEPFKKVLTLPHRHCRCMFP